MESKVEKMPKATVKLSVKIGVDKVKAAYAQALDHAIEHTTIEGFRKGKAPKEMVKDKVGDANLLSEAINTLLQTFYPQALKEHHLIPIANPKVEIKDFDITKDFEFDAYVATKPDVKIGDYKKDLKEAQEKKVQQRKTENEEKIKKGEEISSEHIHLSPNEVIEILLKNSEVEVAEMLVEEETERMMARLVDQAQSIGLSLDQYLKAQNKTKDQLKEEYNKVSERTLKAEFVLGQLVKDLNVEIEDKDIEETMKAAGYENVEEHMKDQMEKFYVKSILQKNKLISNLIEEIEGETKHE